MTLHVTGSPFRLAKPSSRSLFPSAISAQLGRQLMLGLALAIGLGAVIASPASAGCYRDPEWKPQPPAFVGRVITRDFSEGREVFYLLVAKAWGTPVVDPVILHSEASAVPRFHPAADGRVVVWTRADGVEPISAAACKGTDAKDFERLASLGAPTYQREIGDQVLEAAREEIESDLRSRRSACVESEAGSVAWDSNTLPAAQFEVLEIYGDRILSARILSRSSASPLWSGIVIFVGPEPEKRGIALQGLASGECWIDVCLDPQSVVDQPGVDLSGATPADLCAVFAPGVGAKLNLGIRLPSDRAVIEAMRFEVRRSAHRPVPGDSAAGQPSSP